MRPGDCHGQIAEGAPAGGDHPGVLHPTNQHQPVRGGLHMRGDVLDTSAQLCQALLNLAQLIVRQAP